MRLGIIAAASTEPSPDPLLGERDAGLVLSRLELPDVDFRMHVIDPSSDLAEQLDNLLTDEPTPPEVVFYASCLLAVVEDGDCFLCLNPAEPDVGDAIRDVVTVLAERTVSALMILETRFDDRDADGEIMRAVMDALLDCVDGRVELIAAVRPIDAHPERIPSRLTAALLEAIDTHEGPLLPARQAYAIAIQQADLGRWPHAATYAPGPYPMAFRGTIEHRPLPLTSEPPPSGEQRRTSPDGTRLEDEETPPPSAGSAEVQEQPVLRGLAPTPAPSPSSAPPSERKQATVVSVPVRRSPQPAAEPLPKVVISPSSRPPPPDSSPPEEAAEPPTARRPRPRELLDTQPGAPEAMRVARSSDSLVSVASDAPIPSDATPSHAAGPSDGRSKRKLSEVTVDDHVAAGDALVAKEAYEEAVTEYKHALGKLGTATVPLRAVIYKRLGELSRAQGKRRVAISNFDKALTIAPDDLEALESLIELNAADGNWRAVHSAEERFFAAELPAELRFDHLIASGDRWREGAKDRKRARERFQQAHNALFDRVEPLERLLVLHEEDGNIEQVIDIRRHLLGLEGDAAVRARQWFALGEFCMFEARREKDAFEAFEEALDADPTMLEALEVLATALAEVQEWGELERVYEKMVTRFQKRERDDATITVLAELHHRLALVHRDHLEDSESALEELDKELALRPDQLSGQLLAAEVAVEVGDPARAMRYLRRAAQLDPTRSETFHQLFVAARRADDTESAFLAASVTVEMEAADDRERIVYQEHRPQTPPPHSQQLSEEAWEWLRDSDRDKRVERIMHAIAPAVLRHRVKQLDAAGALPRLPDTGPQDPSTTTVSALRSIAWAAQYLGITCPDLYAGEELPGGFTAPFAWKPTTFVGREVLMGKTLLELAFLAGRHLALRIPEHELIAHLTSIDELTACFLAGVHLVLGTTPSAGKLGKPAAALAKLLERQMEEAELEELHEAVNDFSEAGGRADLKRWIASVELCSIRAGYLLCGDLATAFRVLDDNPPNFATAERITHDLYAFAISEDHLSLRHQLGSALDLPEDQAINS